MQLGDVILEAQAAGADLGGVLPAHIPPVPRLVGDLSLILGPLGVAQDEAVLHRVLAQPAEGRGVLKALVQPGVFGAVQVGGKAAVVFGIARRVDDGGGHLLGGGGIVTPVGVVLRFRSYRPVWYLTLR